MLSRSGARKLNTAKQIRGAKITRSKNTDAMGNDAKAKMSEFLMGGGGTCANVRDATPFEKGAQTRDAKAFQGRTPSSATVCWKAVLRIRIQRIRIILPDLDP